MICKVRDCLDVPNVLIFQCNVVFVAVRLVGVSMQEEKWGLHRMRKSWSNLVRVE